MSIVESIAISHLRVHSHYSLLQATAPVSGLVDRAAQAGMQALALTDSYGLYGAVPFATACQAAGIRPIIGMTVPLAAPPQVLTVDAGRPGEVVLLATGPRGYRSLNALSACLQAHADREKRLLQGLAWDDLRNHQEGLLCIDAGLSGWLTRLVRAGHQHDAVRFASRLGAVFPDSCYIGLEIHHPEETELAQELIDLGERFGIMPVAAQPVRYLEPDEKPLLRLLTAIDRNCPLEEVSDVYPDAHWFSPAAVADRFSAFPAAISCIESVCDRCQPALPDGRPIWPSLDLPPGQSPQQALTAQAEAGLQSATASAAETVADYEFDQAAYEQRLTSELQAIAGQGFAPLFLTVADIVRFARTQDIPVSTRGSVANSLVAYVLGITTVDPVAQGLLFERFLNPARANMPDIDLDLCSRRRDEILDFVRDKYGRDQVAIVGTMTTLQPKSAVRETAKALGLTSTRISQLAAMVPRHWHPDPQRRERATLATVQEQLADNLEKKVFHYAQQLIGQPHHLSLHPGGIVITPGPLTDFVPVQFTSKGFLATQFQFRDVEAIGLPKIDLLGIRALTVLADTAALIRTWHDPDFALATIPMGDRDTRRMITQGETIGVFQCESSGAQRTLRQLQAQSIRDLAVANAFFKPGPAMGGMAKIFIRRYRDLEDVSYLHPALMPILKTTKGVLLFQEQVLRIAVEIAGLSWEQADFLRRGMSKFQAREMAAMKAAFVRGCRRQPPGPAFSPHQAETLWEQIMAFAGYGFNQGHATAYADVSYRSAYLKAHFPSEFLCARLADRGGFHHPAIYMAEARRLGIAVRAPHVNFSDNKVTLHYLSSTDLDQWRPPAPSDGQLMAPFVRPVLWLGLGKIRDVRRKSVSAIREGRPYSSLRDLLLRVPLQQKEVLHLIQAGALDGLGDSRSAMLGEAAQIERAGSARQMAFGFAGDGTVAAESVDERLQWETHLLGWPMTDHPLALLEKPDEAVSIRQLKQRPGETVTLAGVRLPGWTGGKGWFCGDEEDFLIVRGGDKPEIWQPFICRGTYRVDEWGGGWLQQDM